MFLPKDIAPHTEFLDQVMCDNLKSGIGELDEVSRQVTRGNSIYIKRYDPKRKSLFQTISYAIKADTNFVSGQAEKFNHSTFPYDKKLSCTSRTLDFDNQRTQDLLFKFHLYPDQVLANANLSHLTAWQWHQRGLYEDAVGEDAKAQVKRRFLKFLRPTTPNRGLLPLSAKQGCFPKGTQRGPHEAPERRIQPHSVALLPPTHECVERPPQRLVRRQGAP